MTLSKQEIENRLLPSKNPCEQIVVTPLLNPVKQIGPCSIDIRLGKQFIIFNEQIQDTFEPTKEKNLEELKKYQDEVVVPFGHCIILHPGKLLIAGSLEYVAIPLDLECQVEGRSSWARLGLITATATTVEPGYKGIITLELSNTGKIPMKLFPGLRIAQLIFHRIEKETANSYKIDSKKKYKYCIGPGISRIHHDTDLDYFSQQSTHN